MWNSEKDMIRDFFIINDSSFPVDEKSYKRPYSNRQEYNLRKKSQNIKHVDPRNGEIKNEEDLFHDSANCKNIGKGRGKIIGSNKVSELQLQKQLRMAKPFGMSNELIESYYSNQKNLGNYCAPENSSRLSKTQEVFENKKEEILKSCNFPPLPSNKIERVKGVRNSKQQNNALLLSLLSRLNEYPKNS